MLRLVVIMGTVIRSKVTSENEENMYFYLELHQFFGS